MKLKDAREIYYFYSGKTSDLVRQLGLAGIAVIWLFKYDAQGIPKISPHSSRRRPLSSNVKCLLP